VQEKNFDGSAVNLASLMFTAWMRRRRPTYIHDKNHLAATHKIHRAARRIPLAIRLVVTLYILHIYTLFIYIALRDRDSVSGWPDRLLAESGRPLPFQDCNM
jgi:hypothetical protein